jgi:hypothetical protein
VDGPLVAVRKEPRLKGGAFSRAALVAVGPPRLMAVANRDQSPFFHQCQLELSVDG